MEQGTHQEEINLSDYVSILWRRKALLTAICTVSVVAAMIVSLLLPKYYKSEAMILAIAPETGGLGAVLSASPFAGSLAGSLGGLSSPADKVLVFLKSRTITQMVVKRFDLVRVFNERKWDAAKGAWKDPAKPPLLEDAVRQLGKKVASFRKSREGTITITVEWKDPNLAAQIANYYVAALAEFMKDKSVNTTVQIVDFAVPAERKSSPRIAMNMIMAGVLSLFVGMLTAVALERLSQRRKT